MMQPTREPSPIRHDLSRPRDGFPGQLLNNPSQTGESVKYVTNLSRGFVTDFKGGKRCNNRYISSLSLNPSRCHAYPRARRPRVCVRGVVTDLRDGFACPTPMYHKKTSNVNTYRQSYLGTSLHIKHLRAAGTVTWLNTVCLSAAVFSNFLFDKHMETQDGTDY